MKKDFSDFNIVISGVGGQGLITLLRIIAEAAFREGYDVKTSELHGLSQRGGSVEVHIRFGSQIYSPLIKAGGADMIIALETQEALTACRYASKKAIFLVNNFFQPIIGTTPPSIEAISKELRNFSENIFIVSASDACRQAVGTDVVAGIYLLGYAALHKLMPLKPESLTGAIEKTISKDYLESNLRTFNLPTK